MPSDIPVIDVGPLRHGTAEARAAVAAALGRACREVGFFTCTGHGVAEATVRAVFDASRRFFARPDAEKRALSMAQVGNNRGYVGLSEERLDPAPCRTARRRSTSDGRWRRMTPRCTSRSEG